MKIAKNTVVTIHYTIKNANGEVVDSTFGDGQLDYVHGVDDLLEGLEKALEGKEAPSSFEVTIPSNEAFGPKEEELIFTVPRNKFPPDMQFAVGDILHSDDEEYEVTVVKVDKNEITVDANHPLAGEDLTFDVSILEVRPATDEEIEYGLLDNEEYDDEYGCDCDDDYDYDCDCDDDCDCGCDCDDDDCDCH